MAKKTNLKRKQGEPFPIHKVAAYLAEFTPQFAGSTMSALAAKTGASAEDGARMPVGDPFLILIGTILSLRTQDKQTEAACEKLFAKATDPKGILKISEKQIAKLIYPVGFYNTKAKTIRDICRSLLDDYSGEVPRDVEELCKLPGVGRKTANLTITLGYGLPGICVDTHVHRICNRWDYIRTKTPDETEHRLRKKLPLEYWIPINEWLVLFGQNICHPTSPKCSECELSGVCARRGVTRSR